MRRKDTAGLLLLFFLASLFQSGRWALAPMAFVAPAIGLFIIHGNPRWRGFLLLLLATYLALLLGWWGVVPFPMPIFPIFMLVNALFASLPFLLDRLLRARLGEGFANTLVFPLAATAIEFLSAGNGPLGSFGASAYTQFDIPALAQLSSVTGLWGISFLTAWVASVLYWTQRRHQAGRPYRGGLLACALVFLLVLGWGGWRLMGAAEAARSVSVAGITVEHTDMAALMGLFGDDREAFGARTRSRHRAYLDKTREAAAAGAKIVVWAELAGLGLAEDVDALVEDGQSLAAELGIYLAMPVFVVAEDEGAQSVNKLVLAGPDGQALFEHVKYGGNIIEGTQPGPRALQTVDTPYGRLSAVICWDTDYPAVVRQAGQDQVDLLLSPSYVWPGVARMHAEMASFRSIENGMTLLRHSDEGYSRVIDPYGRTVASENLVGAGEALFLAEAPIGQVSTRYPSWGDWLGQASVLGLALCVLWALAAGWRERRADS